MSGDRQVEDATENYDVSMVIPTYRRPQLLERALKSCIDQTNKLALKFEIVIVDNCPEKSALPVVKRLLSESPIPICYVSEPRPNIALARNAGFANSRAPMVVFIDDDQEADADCLDHLVATQRQFDADAVIGTVEPVFETGSPPPWHHVTNHCVRRTQLPTGARFRFGGTGNSLIRKDNGKLRSPPFDPAFGHTGSEDLDFFMHLTKTGGKVVWCGEAVANEFVGRERATVRYVARRFFRESQGYVVCQARYSEHPGFTAFYLMFKGLAQSALWVIPSLLVAPFSFPFAVRAKTRLARGLGKLFWMKWFRIDHR